MRQPVRLDGVEALEIEHRLDAARGAGRVAVDDGRDVGAEGLADRRIVRDGLEKGLLDEVGRQGRLVEPRRDAVGDAAFERVVVEDRRKDEAGERPARCERASSASCAHRATPDRCRASVDDLCGVSA